MDPEQIAKLITEDGLWEEPVEEALKLIQKDLEARGYGASYHEDSDSYVIVGDSDDYYGVIRGTRFQRISKIEISVLPKGYGERGKFTKRISFDVHDAEAMKRALGMLDTYVGNK